MSTRHLFLECLAIAMLLAASTGCAHPVITGGNVEFKVYMADESITSLLRTQEQLIPDAEMEGVISKSRLVPRFVVIPHFYRVGEPPFFAAQAVTLNKNHVAYPRRLELATWGGRECLPWETHPKRRAFLYAWVFAEGSWPVYITETGQISGLMNGVILTRWSGLEDAPPPGLEGKATVICFPLSHPWDREVAAAAGCKIFDFNRSNVGYLKTLRVLSSVPCHLIVAVDQPKGLDNADRLMVYRQLLRLYEQTKPHWMSPEATGYGTTQHEAYDKNTKLLRERIVTLEAKAAPSPVQDAK